MSNHTIAAPITTRAELRVSDREVPTRNEVAALLTLDPRTVDHAIEDGTIWEVYSQRKKKHPVATAAIARELAGCCWSLATLPDDM